MDLSAVARQSVSRRVEASASASASRRTEEEEDDDEDLDADEAKALVRAFVKHALDGVRAGERAQYYELLEALEGLEDARVSQDKLLMLTVLVECVSSLDENAHEDLLRRVLSTSLWRCADDVAALVVEFCVNLVSTHTGSLLQTCLEMLVSNFVPPPGYDLALLERDGRRGPGSAKGVLENVDGSLRSRSLGVSPSTTPRPPEAVTAGVVRAVETILTLVPLAASVLRPILLARLPHVSAHKNAQTQYLRAAFALAETEPGARLRDALLGGVVSHLLQVDVEITWEHIRDPADGDDSSDEDVEDDMDGDGDGDADGDVGGAGIFELDDIEKTIEIEMTRQAAVWERDARARGGHFARARQGTSPTTSSGIAGDAKSHAAVDEAADALDSMMEAALAHVDVRIDRGDGQAVADAVLSIFLNTLLPAHTSKFTQFLVFHVCARDAAAARGTPLNEKAPFGVVPPSLPGFAAASDAGRTLSNSSSSFGGAFGVSGRIADALIERVTDPHHPPAGRLASAAYLASFLARAAFLPPAFLAAALARLHRWCAATVAAAANGVNGVTSVGKMGLGASGSSGALARGFGSSFKIADSGSESGGSEGEIKNRSRADTASEAANVSASEYATASAATLAVFDSACQALMYALVYRMEDILKAGGAPAEALRALPLRDVLYSRLEPTKTCLPSVVLEFLHRAADAGLPGFDDDLVERHKAERRAARSAGDAGDVGNVAAAAAPPLRRSASAVAALGGDLAEAVRQRRPLRMFFPFDPYLLRRSAALLRLPLTYVAWRGEVRQGSERDEDEDDLDVDLDDDDDESEPEDESDEEEASGGRGGSRSGSHMGSQGHHSFNSSLPNSLNPRPRKLTRGLLGPQPLFGGRSVSPGSAEAGGKRSNGFGFGFGVASAAAAPPIVGFAAGGVPTSSTFGAGSPGGAPNAPPSPSRLGAPTGSDGGGAKPPRVPKRTTR